MTGESRRARILVEYEADRTASALLDAFRAERSIDPASIDPRVRGFGIYLPTGEAAARFGETPWRIDPEAVSPEFLYDKGRGSLVILRPLGMGRPGAPRGPGGPADPGMPMMKGGRRFPEGRRMMSATLYLEMDISGYYRTKQAYAAASVLAPVAVAGLAVTFLFLLASNIRYRRTAEERETLARLGESARTLAHEIRNPLAAIRIQTALLRKSVPFGKARELDVIDEEAERLNLLARRVGEFLKSPAGMPLDVDITPFLGELARRSPIPVRWEGPPPAASGGPALVVRFDPELLRSVLENLVRNAFESYTGGVEEKDVEIAAAREGRRVILAVRDRGRGIPPELVDKVFDPFFTDKVHGSGIGLALSRRFVEAAGGTLTLSPRQGGGTEARVALPAGGGA